MYIRPEQIGPGANLFDRDLRGANLKEKNLAGADLTRADLTSADLRGALLVGAHLDWAKLDNAQLAYAQMNGAFCHYASFRNADLKFADLSAANLAGADLRGANIHEAITKGCNLTDANLRDITGYGKSLEVFLELVRQLEIELSDKDWQIIGRVVGEGICWRNIVRMYKCPPFVVGKLKIEGFDEFIECWLKYSGG